MGVTLERVQNKFACIIGELSNNPKILSQFAIWVDLRISEYKSKGAISLECSGDEPDPSWLLGHKGSLRRAGKREQTPEDYCYDKVRDADTDNWNAGSIPVETLHERLNPETVQIKEEFTEFVEDSPVFPVPVQLHEKRFGSWGRKRKADNNHDNSVYGADHADFSPKMRQQEDNFSSVQSTESSKNESFQSVIKDTMHDHGNSSTALDEDEESFTDIEHLGDSSVSETPSTSNISALPSACWSRNSGNGSSSQEIYSPVVNRSIGSTTKLTPWGGKPLRNWTQDDMKKAVAAVTSGFLSQRAASRLYHVPLTSIHRRVSGKIIPSLKRPYTNSDLTASNLMHKYRSSQSLADISGNEQLPNVPEKLSASKPQSLANTSVDKLHVFSSFQENQSSHQWQSVPPPVISNDKSSSKTQDNVLQSFSQNSSLDISSTGLTSSQSHDSEILETMLERPVEFSTEEDVIVSPSTTWDMSDKGLFKSRTTNPVSNPRQASDLNINLNTIAKVRETLSLPAERPSVNISKQKIDEMF